jgi:hypothetical protein
MKIREGDADLSERKTLKVSVPTKLHLQLHSVKILQGRNISDTVQAALSEYFDDQFEEAEEASEADVNGGPG